jgi:hypothetical protein
LRAAALAERVPTPVVLVLEGAARPGVEEGTEDGVDVVHAAGEGDDTMAAIAAAAAAEGEPVTLVSADRGLRERVLRTGGQVVGPGWLLDRLPE